MCKAGLIIQGSENIKYKEGSLREVLVLLSRALESLIQIKCADVALEIVGNLSGIYLEYLQYHDTSSTLDNSSHDNDDHIHCLLFHGMFVHITTFGAVMLRPIVQLLQLLTRKNRHQMVDM